MSALAQEEAVTSLAGELRGPLLLPGSDEYEAARRVFNGMIDRRPAMVAQVLGTADVRAVVDYAREHDLPVAVRGGGHNVAGHGTCDGGVLIDFSRMRTARVDSASRTVRADPGCWWTDFDIETVAQGMATTGGTVGSTGIAGLTLGGGLGFLMGSYGLSCDNLLAADVVTADGRLLTASERENADLYWALRGGGGNFGVVTSFEYRLYPVSQLLAGLVVYPTHAARQALELFRTITAEAPDELSCIFAMLELPDGPRVAVIAACYNGPHPDGERLIAPLRSLGPPIDDGIRSMRYTEVQRIFAEIPFGLHNYWKGHFLRELSDEAIDATMEAFQSWTSAHSAILIEAPHGAASRVAADATAFGQRDARYNASALAIWEPTEEPDQHVRWSRSYADAIHPFASGEYLNYLPDDASRDDVKDAFGDSRFRRLVDLKTRYDPANMFRFNQNIEPTPSTQPAG
jgi:FAD/FMN-containing dehydrogenase